MRKIVRPSRLLTSLYAGFGRPMLGWVFPWEVTDDSAAKLPKSDSARRGFETLEPRMLFSGNPLLAPEIEEISLGISAFESLGERIDQDSLLSDPLGIFGSSITTGEPQSLGDVFDLSDTLRDTISQPTLDYFSQTSAPTATGLRDAINSSLTGLVGAGNVTVENLTAPVSATDSFEFDIEFSFAIDAQTSLSIDLGEVIPSALLQTDAVLEADVSTTVDLDFTLGFNRNAAPGSDPFFIRFDSAPGANQLTFDLDFADGFSAAANAGVLGVTLGLDPASEQISFAVPLSVGLGDLSAADTESAPLADIALPTPSGATPFALTLPITVDAGFAAFDPQSVGLLIQDDDLFDWLFDSADNSYVTIQNDAEIVAFRNLTNEGLFSGLTALEDTFTSFARSDAFNQAIPLLKSLGLGDLAPLGEAIADKITSIAGTDAGNGDETGSSGAGFSSIQELAGLIGNGLSYDPVANEVVIDVSFSHLFSIDSAELDFGVGLGDLTDFDFSASALAEVGLQLDAMFGLGISLETPGVESRNGILPVSFIDGTTALSYFGLKDDQPDAQGTLNADGADFRITLHDGTTAEFDVTESTTLDSLIASINSAFGSALVAEFETRVDPVSDTTYVVGIMLTDSTSGGVNSVLRVEALGGSLAPFALSIARSTTDAVIASGPIHQRGISDQLFIQTPDAGSDFLATTVQIIASDIDARASFGPVGVGIDGGEITAQLGGTVSLGNPSERYTLRQAQELVPLVDFAGSASMQLPISTSVAGLNIANEVVTVSVPDLLDLTSPGSVVADFSGLGDLQDLKNLDASDIANLLAGAVDLFANLEVLEGLDLFNQDLPLIDLSLADALDISTAFLPVFTQFESEPNLTFDLAEEMIEDILGFAEDSDGTDPLLPDFAVYQMAALNTGLVFERGSNTLTDANPIVGNRQVIESIDLSDADAFPTYGVLLNGIEYSDLTDFLAALQGDSPVIDLVFDDSGPLGPAVRLDLQLSAPRLLGMGADVFTLERGVNISLDNIPSNGPQLGDLVTFDINGQVGVDLNADLFLSLGIDLSDPDSPRPFFYDANAQNTSGTRIEAGANTSPGQSAITFNTAVGPFGVTADNVMVDLNSSVSVGLADLDGTGRTYFDDLTAGTSLVAPEAGTAGASTSTPITADPQQLILGVINQLPIELIQIEASGSADASMVLSIDGLPLSETFTATIADLSSPTNVVFTGGDIFTNAYNAMTSGDFNLVSMIGGWDGALDLLINALDGELLGLDIPFVGDKLGEQADFLRRVKTSVSENLTNSNGDIASPVGLVFEPVQSAIYDALGPNGINLLEDIDGDNQITINDIVITDTTVGTDPGFEFTMKLGESLGLIDAPIDFDLGIPGLNFDLDANVQASIGFELGLSFGVNTQDGFYINTGSVAIPGGETVNTGLEVMLEVAVPGLDASGELGIFRINANALTDEELLALIDPLDAQDPDRAFVKLKPDPDNAGEMIVDNERNGVFGQFTVDILDPNAGTANANDDGKLTLSEITRVGSFSEIVAVGGSIEGNLNLGFEVEAGDSDQLPSVRGNLLANIGYSSGSGFDQPEIRVSDLELDLGGFFGGFASDIFDEIDNVIDPVRPIIDVLQSPIPVLSDLDESITFLDMARLMGGRFAGAANFVDAVGDLISLSDTIGSLTNEDYISLGGASLVYNDTSKSYDFVLDDDNLFAEIMDSVSTKTGSDAFRLPGATPDQDKLDVSFPILNPSNIIGMLTGETVDLFTLELPTFDLDFTMAYVARLPIFPPLGVELAGSIGAKVDLAFGFDSFGIEQFKETGNVANIFNGFYISDRENADGTGADIDELTLRLGVSVAAGLDIGVASAFVGGGLTAQVFFDFHDNNDDGKIRAIELLDNTLLGLQDGLGPIHIFDVSGKLTAGLFVEVEVLLLTKTFEVATIDIFDFNFPRPDGEGFSLAEQSGGRLDLNIGDRAGLRSDFILNEDEAEDFRITNGVNPDTIIVEAYGRQQTFTGVTEIHGNAGTGDDKITVADNVAVRVILDGGEGDDVLIGGAGDDEIEGGTGNDELRGNGGDDTLRGNGGADTLIGGAGNDDMAGGAGRDNLQGEGGNDILRGNEDDDTLLGGAGDDEIEGGAGNDQIEAGSGDDVVTGGAGNDTIDGEGGGDTIDGGAGNDLLVGGDGADEIRGGTGDDLIRGGTGNDTIFGDAGNDQLFGENSRDTIYGGTGNDLIEGGLAGDDLFGGLGDDRLYANLSDSSIIDPANHTLVGGGGNDIIVGAMFDPVGPFFAMTIFGDGVNDELGSLAPATDGGDTITTYEGNDFVTAGGGNDLINTGAGNDEINAGVGNDVVNAGSGDDFVIGGLGNDRLDGGDGRDALIGGVSFNSVTPADFALANLINPVGVTGSSQTIVPSIVAGLSIDGFAGTGVDDGIDILVGQAGDDWLFGGSAIDQLFGGDGNDYLDGGLGNETVLLGEAGDDVIRGGKGDDLLRGGTGVDILLGDEGEDKLYGDATAPTNLVGLRQMLFGGDGADELFAFAPLGASGDGDMLFGDAGNDILRGNILDEHLDGGDGNDRIFGDILSGPNYAINIDAATTGGNDLIFGGLGEDQLFGGGGDDTIYGGGDSDNIEGQAGSDTQYGGSGIDRFFAPTRVGHNVGTDVIDGHYGNATQGDVPDDNATDMLVIDGTSGNDTIILSQVAATGQLFVTHPNGALTIDWLDGTTPLIEQFQIAGHSGNDTIGFGIDSNALGAAFDISGNPALQQIDFSSLQNRRDFIGVFDGGSGNDILGGAGARDRLDGGVGSDMMFGLGGDDRLYGDGGGGAIGDFDALFAGAGNDDLIGGQGQNALFAWSIAPDPLLSGDITALQAALPGFLADGPSADFGVSLVNGVPTQGANGGADAFEDTGINRIIGQQRDDVLFGGTLVDFLYGNGGNDTLVNRDGSTFESLDGGQAGDEWKQYAKANDAVWYVSGSGSNDKIDVNFVTEPGLLTDHHLVTRLTENNGQFTFDASVRLDFSARDTAGELIWDANEVLNDANARLDAINTIENANGGLSDEDRAAQLSAVDVATTNLVNGLLPPEGDFSVIVIDALGGRDEITVGPTVQKTVWIDAGDDDDIVTIQGGNAILVDKTEDNSTGNGVRGRNDSPDQAYTFDTASGNLRVDNLTLDNPDDTDWYRFTTPDTIDASADLSIASLGIGDELTLTVYTTTDADTPAATGTNTVALSTLAPNTEYLLKVESANRVPTTYGLDFDFDATGTPVNTIDLGRASTASERRDVILGGDGDDILTGGAGEDFIFGNAGNDVLIGGKDRGASDLLFGGAGDDTYQIVPDELPLLNNGPGTVFTPDSDTYLPAASDQFIDTEGEDRILFLGGDLDRRGFEVPDFAALRYNTVLHRYEFASLVWDIGQQKFITEAERAELRGQTGDANRYATDYYFFQARGVETTSIILGEGDDVFHADTDFRFPMVDGTLLQETWGVDLGDFEQGGTALNLTIDGGGGDDQLFGGALADTLLGGEGDDEIQGGTGEDDIQGGGGADTIFGNADDGDYAGSGASITPLDPDEVVSGVDKFLAQFPGINPALFVFPSERYNFEPTTPFFTAAPTLPGVALTDQDGAEVSVSDAFAVIGSQTNERLSGIKPFGDFNGDGQQDYIVVGDQRAYIFTQPIDATFLISAELAADYIVDISGFGVFDPATGKTRSKFARTFGDTNGDGLIDISFVYEDENNDAITASLFPNTNALINAGFSTGDYYANLPRLIDKEFILASSSQPDSPLNRIFSRAKTDLRVFGDYKNNAGVEQDDAFSFLELDIVNWILADPFLAIENDPDDLVLSTTRVDADGRTLTPWLGVVYNSELVLFTSLIAETNPAAILDEYDRAATITTGTRNVSTDVLSDVVASGNLTFVPNFASSGSEGPTLFVDNGLLQRFDNVAPTSITGSDIIKSMEGLDMDLLIEWYRDLPAGHSPVFEVDMDGVTSIDNVIEAVQLAIDSGERNGVNGWVLVQATESSNRLVLTSLDHTSRTFTADDDVEQSSGKLQIGPLGAYGAPFAIEDTGDGLSPLTVQLPAPVTTSPGVSGSIFIFANAANSVGNVFYTMPTITGTPQQRVDDVIAQINSQLINSVVRAERGTTVTGGTVSVNPSIRFVTTVGPTTLQIVHEVVHSNLLLGGPGAELSNSGRAYINAFETPQNPVPTDFAIQSAGGSDGTAIDTLRSGASAASTTNSISGQKFEYNVSAAGDPTFVQVPLTVGDVNRDGANDLAWYTSLRGATNAAAVFFNAGQQTTKLTNGDADILFTGSATMLVTGLASGDFDGDGSADIAVSYNLSEGGDNKVAVFFDLDDRAAAAGGVLSLSIANEADLTLVGETAGDGFGVLGNSMPIDLNGDGLDDLVIGATNALGANGTSSVAAGGKAYILYGQARDASPQAGDTVEELSNFTVPGSGSYLVDRGTGQAERFDNGGQLYTLDGTNAQYFRFSTLGDAMAANSLRLADADSGVAAQLLDADYGQIVAHDRSAFGLQGLEAGTYVLRVTGPADAQFAIEVDAPITGQTFQTQSSPDADRIDGQDGDDTLVGQDDLDTLVGGSGADTFFGESFEIGDATSGDTVNPADGADLYTGPAAEANPLLTDTALIAAILNNSDIDFLSETASTTTPPTSILRESDLLSITTLDDVEWTGLIASMSNLKSLATGDILGEDLSAIGDWEALEELLIFDDFFTSDPNLVVQSGQAFTVGVSASVTGTTITRPDGTVESLGAGVPIQINETPFGTTLIVVTTTGGVQTTVPLIGRNDAPQILGYTEANQWSEAFGSVPGTSYALYGDAFKSIANGNIQLTTNSGDVGRIALVGDDFDPVGRYEIEFDYRASNDDGNASLVLVATEGNNANPSGDFGTTTPMLELKLSHIEFGIFSLIDDIDLERDGVNVINIDPSGNGSSFPNNNTWHRLKLTVDFDAQTASLTIINQVLGTAVEETYYTDVAIPGLDPRSFRIGFQAQLSDPTAGFHRIDNIDVTQVVTVNNAGQPEVSNADLLALYTFEDSATSDLSGDLKFGAFNGLSYAGVLGGDATLSANVSGVNGGSQSLFLDGSGDFIDLPINAVNPFDGSQDYTITSWFKSDATGNRIILSSARDTVSDNHSMAFFQSQEIGSGVLASDNFFLNAAWSDQTLTQGDGQWHFGAVIYDADTQTTRVHLDGLTGSARSFNPAIPNISEDTVRIGGTLNTVFPTPGDWLGNLDDVAIFSGTLTDSELAAVRAGDFSDFVASAFEGDTITASEVEQLLIGGTPTIITDANGDSTVSSVTITDPNGQQQELKSSAFTTSGAHPAYMTVDSPLLNGFTEATVSAWIKPDTIGTFDIIAGNSSQFFLGVRDNGDLFAFVGSDKAQAAYPLPMDEWAHVAAVTTGQELILYVNGAELTRTTLTVANQGPLSSISTFVIGGDATTSSFRFEGLIDEVTVSGRALAAEELLQLATDSADLDSLGLIAYWDFEDIASPIVKDRVGNHDGVIRPYFEDQGGFIDNYSLGRDESTSYTFADEGTYTARFTVTDIHGAIDFIEATIEVANLAPATPTIVTGVVPAATGLDAIELSLTGLTDAGPADADQLSVLWTITPASTGDALVTAAGESYTFQPTFADQYTVTATVSDPDGGQSTASATLNINPVVEVTLDQTTVQEGSTVNATATLQHGTTPGLGFVYDWTVRDAQDAVVLQLTDQLSNVLAFKPVNDGDYTIEVNYREAWTSTLSGTGTISLVVSDVAPTLSIIDGLTAQEGQTPRITVRIDDPGALDQSTVVIEWGDGTTTELVDVTAGVYQIDKPTPYATPGDYVLTARLDESLSGPTITQMSATLTVDNLAPRSVVAAGSPTIADGSIVDGDEVTFNYIFTDDNPATFTWDFGDGTTTGPIDTASTDPVTHIYANSGTYTATVTIEDTEGQVTQSTVKVVVANVAPTLNTASIQANAGGEVRHGTPTKITGTLDDFDRDFVAVTIDFGDGTVLPAIVTRPASVTGLVQAFGFSATHLYDPADQNPLAPVSRTVTVTALDSDGQSSSHIFTLDVLPTEPVANEEPNIFVNFGGAAEITSHDFGAINSGQRQTRRFYITNTGDMDLIVNRAPGLNVGSAFVVTPVNVSNNPSDDWTIGAGETFEIIVKFKPTSAGTFTDELFLDSNDPDTPRYTISLTGEALFVPGPNLVVNFGGVQEVTSHDFGTVNAGERVSRRFFIDNTGDSDLVVNEALGLPSDSPFSITPANRFSTTDDWTIPQGGTFEFIVFYNPDEAGDNVDELLLFSNDSDEPRYTIAISGTALYVPGPDLVVTFGGVQEITSYEFGGVAVGERPTRRFTVENQGDSDLIVDRALGLAAGSPFTITPNNRTSSTDDWTIAPGETFDFVIRFEPTAAGLFEDQLQLFSNDPTLTRYDIALFGSGTQAIVQAGSPRIDDTNLSSVEASAVSVKAYTPDTQKTIEATTDELNAIILGRYLSSQDFGLAAKDTEKATRDEEGPTYLYDELIEVFPAKD